MATRSSTVTAPERTLVTTRVFDAPRGLVYKAWTDPKQLAKWFPPEGFSTAACELDVRVGGTVRIDMQAPAGEPFSGAVFPGRGTYTDVVPNERLAFTFVPEMPDGTKMSEVLMTVWFEEQAGRTKVTIHQTLATVADYEAMVKQGMSQGINESLGKLAGVLSGNDTDRGVEVTGRTLTLTRVFKAPRPLVYRCLVEPEHITKWFFANDWESPTAEIDARVGGKFAVGMRPVDGSAEGFVFGGTFREVVSNERIVWLIGDGRVMTTTLEDVAGGTRLTLSVEMAMSEEQERGGYTQILDHFAAHLASLS